jgi:hypothetical protein
MDKQTLTRTAETGIAGSIEWSGHYGWDDTVLLVLIGRQQGPCMMFVARAG